MEQKDTYPPQLLTRAWNLQQLYNRRIKQRVGNTDATYWTKHYLLGLVSELDEVLREIQWKEHRNKPVLLDRKNLALELADLTKYVLSLWQANGFTQEEMLEYVFIKSRMLEAQYTMEFASPLEEGKPVLFIDIDGTLGDYRAAFGDWLATTEGVDLAEDDTATSLQYDLDNGLAYPQYYEWKEKFEAGGGYATLKPYWDTVDLIQGLRKEGVATIVYTARPAGRYKYIWHDTFSWLEDLNLIPYQLHIGEEERIIHAHQLLQAGHPVLMLDDNPQLISRASRSGIPVLAREHHYNEKVEGLPLVVRVHDYSGSLPYIREMLHVVT